MEAYVAYNTIDTVREDVRAEPPRVMDTWDAPSGPRASRCRVAGRSAAVRNGVRC